MSATSNVSASDLASIVSTLSALEQRVAAMTIGLGDDDSAEILSALVESERAFRTTRRHLERASSLAAGRR